MPSLEGGRKEGRLADVIVTEVGKGEGEEVREDIC